MFFAALSKPHLFEGRGHNRQGSDSSVDRFIPKEEPAEPETDNKVEIKSTNIISMEVYIKHVKNNKFIMRLILRWSYVWQTSRIKGPIGHYTDQEMEPLVHCVRLLSASFLLTGQKKGKWPNEQ